MKTFVVIPAFNDTKMLDGVINTCLEYVDHVVIVDDGSRQPVVTSLAPRPNLTVLRHAVNLGKGASLKTGAEWVVGQAAELIVFLDADGQHDPSEIPHLVQPIQVNRADVVFGVRSFQKHMPAVARLGNTFLTFALSAMFRIRVSDTQSGYRAIRASIYPQIAWRSPRYAVETEMVVNTGKHHLRYVEVPISTIYLDRYKGTTIFDGLRIFINMLAWRFL